MKMTIVMREELSAVKNMAGPSEEFESLIKKERNSQSIPFRAKKSLLTAGLLFILGCVCLGMFIDSFMSGTDYNGGKWFLGVFGCLSVLSALYTYTLAWKIYNREEGYYWPQLFF